MVTFDFSISCNSFLNTMDIKREMERKGEVFSSFEKSSMIGWMDPGDATLIEKIFHIRDRIKQNSKCLVVIGIGGSFLGSYAMKEMFSDYFSKEEFPIIYAGTSLSSQYMDQLLSYLKTIDFSVQVISKSGTTMETMITYQLVKQLMEEKYSKEELRKRIIITTDSKEGSLRKEAETEGYDAFIIPNNIGGRYSITTPAHLLAMSFFLDISKFLEGFYQGLKRQEEAYQYAVVRKLLFERGKYIENFCVYEPKLYYFTEWLKQLFGETEGKEQKGIFPVSTVHTRDLHSLGQFIQEGNPILFETFFKIHHSTKILYNQLELHHINNVVLDSVVDAHISGGVPCNLIELDQIEEDTIGQLCAFFMLSAAYSGYLFGVDPFNQPGVEVYKKRIRENLELHF